MDRAEVKMQAEELQHNFKEFESVETTQKDVEFFEFIMKMLDGDLSSFTTEELLEEIKSRKSTIVLEKIRSSKGVDINNTFTKIELLEAMRNAFKSAPIDSSDFEGLEVRERLKSLMNDIVKDYKRFNHLLNESAVG